MNMKTCPHCKKEILMKTKASLAAHKAKCKVRIDEIENKVKEITKDFLIEEYINKGISMQYIAKSLGLESKHIRKKLTEFNLPVRNIQEAKKMTHHLEISKETSLKKYGVEWNIQNLEIQEKSKNTCLDKYGVENVFQSEVIKDKIKVTCLEKYGSENPYGSEIIKNKIKETCLEKYGVENIAQSTYFKEKLHNTFKKIGKLKSTETFKKEVLDLVGGEYEVLEEYISAKDKILFKCNKCNHQFKMEPNNFLSGVRCPKCNISKGENAIEKWLDNHNINFYWQHGFSDCKNKRKLPFDFYLPDYNYCIEFDGAQHFEPHGFGSKNEQKILEGFNQILKHDKIKNNFCKNNGIKLIRIPYWDLKNIDLILTRELNLPTQQDI